MKVLLTLIMTIVTMLILGACSDSGADAVPTFEFEELPPSTGRIFLFGEHHGIPHTNG